MVKEYGRSHASQAYWDEAVPDGFKIDCKRCRFQVPELGWNITSIFKTGDSNDIIDALWCGQCNQSGRLPGGTYMPVPACEIGHEA